MKFKLIKNLKLLLVIIVGVSLSGCAVTFKETPPEEVRKAKKLEQEVKQLDTKLQQLRKEKRQEIQRLKEVKETLEKRLKKEMQEDKVKLGMDERGLIITVADKILFDAGKAKLKEKSFKILGKVARILKQEVPNKNVGIEGHTDNQPIKYSGWESNWELSSARALNVLHYFVNKKNINPERLSARGYGPYRPVATNKTPQGRQKNRRVEIVILPELTKAEKEFLEENVPPQKRGIK